MLRSILFVMLTISGMSLAAQQAVPVKKSCNVSQCQAGKSAATTTSSSATTRLAVAQTTTAPERAAAPATAATCVKKTSVLPANLQLASLLEEKNGAIDTDTKNCNPANCVPSACDPSTKMTTTLAAKQE